MTTFRATLSALAVIVTASLGPAASDDAGWTILFNGKDLTGWEPKNGTATYAVEDGAIVGTTSEGSPNSFLCTTRDYGDFELTLEVKVDDPLNAGIQIRSRSVPEVQDGRVHGPQVEVAVNGTAGYIYGEALDTGWLSEDREDPAANAAFKPGAWNGYRILAEGNRIRTWVNGVPVADLEDTRTGMDRGFIGLQVHAIARGEGPYQVRYRNIKIRELP